MTRAKTLTIGGESALPILYHEVCMPHKPALAIEIRARKPDDWAPLLIQVWGEAMENPGDWAKATEEAGADLIYLVLSLTTLTNAINKVYT